MKSESKADVSEDDDYSEDFPEDDEFFNEETRSESQQKDEEHK